MPVYKYLNSFLVVMLLLTTGPQQHCLAQAPDILWQKSLGGTDNDEAERIIQTSDGSYILLGWSYSHDGDIVGQPVNITSDTWIAKMDPVGNIIWKRIIGGAGWDAGVDIKPTADGGYIICGNTDSDNGDMLNLALGSSDGFVLKLDALGNIQWIKTYGGSQYDAIITVEQTADGGYIAAGYTGSLDHDVLGNHGDLDGWIVKLDGAGNIKWQRCIGGTDRDVAWAVKPTPDGGYVFTGDAKSTNGDVTNPKGQEDLIVGKLDSQGNLVWLKNFGGSQLDMGLRILIANDGNYIICGYTFSADDDAVTHYGQNDIWVLKVDPQGNLIWQKVFGGSNYDSPNSIVETNDGGFLIGGSTSSSNGDVSANHGDNDCWILKLDVNGTLQWQKTMGGSLQDICHDVIPLTGGGFMAVGTTYSTDGDITVNKGKTDIWLVRLGECQLNEPSLPSINATSATPCAGALLTYTVTPSTDATGYTWSVPDGWTILSGQGTTQITVLVGTNAGDIKVLSFNTCKFSAQQTLALIPVVVAPPTISINSDQGTGICKRTPVVFTAQAGNEASARYQWKKNGINVGSNSTQYSDNGLLNNDLITCEVTSTSACGSPVTILSQAITAIVRNPVTPEVSIASDLTSICKGTLVNLNVTTKNVGDQPQYTWYVNNNLSGTNRSSFSSQAFSDADIITCSVTSNETCVTTNVAISNPIIIAVNANTQAEILISTPVTTICKSDEVTFTATTSNAGTAAGYQWNINGTQVGANNASFKTPGLTDQDKITCTIVPGQNTCATEPETSNTITISINPLPVITLYPTDTIVAPGTQVTMHALINQDIRSFHWTPADMLINSSLLIPITVPIKQATTYRLDIVTMDGCRLFEDATIKPMYPLYIPSAFTPDGDGKNDVFRIPPYVEFDLSELTIFNRWGHAVFFTRDISAGWDGRFRAVYQPSHVYIYQISGLVKGKKVLLKGPVTLIR